MLEQRAEDLIQSRTVQPYRDTDIVNLKVKITNALDGTSLTGWMVIYTTLENPRSQSRRFEEKLSADGAV